MITNAAATARNVVGLVYVAAVAPVEGERLGEVESSPTDGVLNIALVALRSPTGSGPGAETAIECAFQPARFHGAFAADLPAEQVARMAATQRPVAELACSEPSGEPACKTLSAWAVVASGDQAAGSVVIRSMAQRAKATISEVAGSHVNMLAQPQVVADLILRAVAAGASAVGTGH